MVHIPDVKENYNELFDYLSSQYETVNGYEFYKDLFPNNENVGEMNTDFSQPNAVYLYQDEKDEGSERTFRRRIMLKDIWEEDYMEFVEGNPMTLCSGLTYRGRKNQLENAQQMNALIFDLDSVGIKELNTLFKRFDENPEWIRTLPRPTYVSISGSGLHLYYFLEESIDLFPNIKDQFRELKHILTFRLWEYRETTKEENIQYQGINQGFRMIGSLNKKYGLPVVAFKTGERVSVDYLNSYVHDENKRVDVQERFFTEYTLEEAQIKFPEWYQKVIIEGNKKRKNWTVNRALYDWWKKKIPEIKGGHRYYFLMVLVIYGVKCNIPKKEVEKDLYELYEIVKKVQHEHELTLEDVEAALDVYDPAYNNFPIDVIVEKTGIQIQKNKRNYRKQDLHLKGARAIQEINDPNQNWRNLEGRPKGSGTKEKLVKNYIEENPKANPTKIARDLEISRSTVYKYMKE